MKRSKNIYTCLLFAVVVATCCMSAVPQVVGLPSRSIQMQAGQPSVGSSVPLNEDETIDLLIRKYSSDAPLASAGHIQMVWLNPELIDALLDKYGAAHNSSPEELKAIKAELNVRLHTSDSLAFLVIFRPAKDGYISGPIWEISNKVGFPTIYLRGTGGQEELPYSWDQILGDGEFHWYSDVTYGYLLFKASSKQGRPILARDERSFSIELRDAVETTDGALYDTRTDYFFTGLMPVSLPNLVDSSIPTWNESTVQMREQRNRSDNYLADGTRASSYDNGGRLISSEGNAVKLPQSDIIQIAALVLQFAEFFAKIPK